MKKIFAFTVSFILGFSLITSYELSEHLKTAMAEEETDKIFEGFSDVKEENYHYLPINELAKEGIINGYDDGLFRSKSTINRAEALKIIMETFLDLSKEELSETEDRPFDDVPSGEWYAKYVSKAKELKIVNGYEDGSFRPLDTLSLAEALKMIVQSMETYIRIPAEEGLFADIPVDSWFSEYFSFANSREMLNISAENKVFPGQEVTRGYFAEIIYKLKKNSAGFSFGKATFYGAAVHGAGTASGKTFDMYAMTAAHKTLPFGTIVEVTNLANGKSVQVEITDRGPYGPGRVIDLTSSAFKEISELHRGIINVQYKIVDEN